MYQFRKLVASACFLFLCNTAYSEVATISGVYNEIQPDTTYITVVVDGVNLGPRPNIVYYNDFRKDKLYTSVAANGGLAGVTRLRLGRVPMVSTYHSTPGFYVVDDTSDQITILEAFLGESQSKVFVAYSVAIPDGYTAPASSEPKKWFEGSSWKLNWLLQSPQAYSITEEFDLCGPTMIGTGSALMGNSSLFVSLSSGGSYTHARVNDWWTWDDFNHMQVIFDGDTYNPKNSTGSFSVVNERVGYINYPHMSDRFVYKGPTPKITQINFPGWARNTAEDKFQAIYSNIYVSAGDGFLSRIEITDSENYSKSSYRRVVFPKEWSQTEIKFDVYKSEVKANKNLFFHYFDQNGNKMKDAYKVCLKCPKFSEGSSSVSSM